MSREHDAAGAPADPQHADPVPYATLADWLEGRLAGADAARVAALVGQGDDRLRGAVVWLQGFLECARELRLERPPALVRQRLRQHFERWSKAKAILEQPPLVVQATLLFDSRLDRPLAHVRGASDSAVVHLAYRAEEADLVLDIHPLPGGQVRLEGQVLMLGASEAPVFEAIALGPDFTVRSVDGDELGRFALGPLPAVAVELRTSNGELTAVAALDLRTGST